MRLQYPITAGELLLLLATLYPGLSAHSSGRASGQRLRVLRQGREVVDAELLGDGDNLHLVRAGDDLTQGGSIR